MADTLAAWVHPEQVAHSWFTSLMSVVMTSTRVGPYTAMRCGTDGLPTARNRVAAQFLASDLEWLWWSDTDQGFAPDALDRLLASADPVERPIMGALAFAQTEVEIDGMGGYHTKATPTLYRWVERVDGQSGFTPMYDYPRDQVVRVGGTGSAMIVIHRSVFEAIAVDGPVWYTRMMNPTTGQLVGEDLSFCARAAAKGFPIHVDTSVKTNHLKPIWLQEEHYTPPGGDQ